MRLLNSWFQIANQLSAYTYSFPDHLQVDKERFETKHFVHQFDARPFPVEMAPILTGADERVQVEPMTSPPYKWICFLTIESVLGKKFVATGFKICLPDVDRTAVVTSGHCTFVDGAYAARITVQFPGQMLIEAGPDDLYFPPEYISSGSAEHNYGFILLPGRSDDGFGWSAIVKGEELDNRPVMNCGFPADKPPGSMWIRGYTIASHTDKTFELHDTSSASGISSGSPVYLWYGGYWTAVGVCSCDGRSDTVLRFTVEMISRFLHRKNGLKVKTLRSVAFPDVYVRCDGRGVTQWAGPGSGTVNCQYKPPREWERFYVYPVEVNPCLAVQNTCKVVIESAKWKNVFIRMTSQGMNHFNGAGGGKVNCQLGAGAWEVFVLRKESNGGYSFRNDHFTHCYIRLDGRGVHSQTSGGCGTVNCQYYEPGSPPKEWETFYIEEN